MKCCLIFTVDNDKMTDTFYSQLISRTNIIMQGVLIKLHLQDIPVSEFIIKSPESQ